MGMRWVARSGIFMILAGLVVAAGGVALGSVVTGVFTGLLMMAGGVFNWWLCRGWEKPLEDPAQLLQWGRPANAEVHSVEDVTLAADGTRTAKVELRVSPVNEGAYSSSRMVVLPKGRVPLVGETVTVKFDPNRRRDFVLLEHNETVEDHVTAALRGLSGAGRP